MASPPCSPSQGVTPSVESSSAVAGVVPPTGWDRCHFYVVGKRRFCRQFPLEQSLSPSTTNGPRYCGNHQHVTVTSDAAENHNDNSSTTLASNDNTGGGRKRKRIPCPLDGSHFIFEDQVAKHVKICPYQVRQDRQQEKEFFQCNVNLGGHGSLHLDGPILPPEFNESDWAQQLALRILQVHQQLFATTMANSAKDYPSEVKNLTKADILDAVPLVDCHANEIEPLTKSVNHYRIKSGGPRHLAQQASFIGHLRRIIFDETTARDAGHKGDNISLADGTLTDSKVAAKSETTTTDSTTILEMGAGRGMLGLMVAGVVAAQGETTQLVMIERSGTRGKADKVLRAAATAALTETSSATKSSSSAQDYMDLARIQSWRRVRCDLAHIHLPTLVKPPEKESDRIVPSGSLASHSEPVASARLVVVAKHLCGAGTDLALKSLVPVRDRVDVCLMATCCHGVCSWDHYVGRDYLQKVLALDRFGQVEFDLLRRWAANASHGVESLDEDTATTATTSSWNEEKDTLVCQTCPSIPQTNHATPNQDNLRAIDGVDDVLDQPVTGQNRDTDESSKDPKTSIQSVVKNLDLACGVSGFGKACQRLIDYGRCEYLRRVLFQEQQQDESDRVVDLCSFVPFSITPQNTLLVAYRKR